MQGYLKTILVLAAFSLPHPVSALTLQPGDILLQSQPCFMCALMEIEEGLPYSHAGVVTQESNGSLSILEAWNKIDRVPLAEFLKRRRKDTETLAVRPPYLPSLAQNPSALNRWLRLQFEIRFAGHSYDPAFLWNNGDGNGESYYCSELVAKLIDPALVQPLRTKPMHFNQHREYWVKYFGGTPPDGQPGISPADIARTATFRRLGKF